MLSPTVSLFDSLLPQEGSLERNELNRLTKLPSRGNPKQFNANCSKMVKIGKLLLIVAQETAQALLDAKYTSFDALIRNFGCQMTALEVMKILRNKSLLNAETERIIPDSVDAEDDPENNLATKIKNASIFLATKCPQGELGMDLAPYLQDRASLDIKISPEMVRLVRLRLLCIVNNQHTDPQLLVDKLGKMKSDFLKPINLIVRGVQAEESAKAADYIYQTALGLTQKEDATPRAALLERCLRDQFRRAANIDEGCSPIISVPLLYNNEVAIRAIEGVVLVKNKFTVNEKPLPVKPVCLYIQMPQERFLTKEEVSSLPEDELLYVIEGAKDIEDESLYAIEVKGNKALLRKSIAEQGLIQLINVQNANWPRQYIKGASQDPLNDSEAITDIADLKTQEDTSQIIKIDHMYCASIKEERK